MGADQVEIDVEYCGICHSDLSMVNNDWDMSQYPVVPGHEAVGKIAAVGSAVKKLQVGQRVGLGWYSNSCMHCEWCLSGDHNLCLDAEETIIGRYGAFADKVRGHQKAFRPAPTYNNLDCITVILKVPNVYSWLRNAIALTKNFLTTEIIKSSNNQSFRQFSLNFLFLA